MPVEQWHIRDDTYECTEADYIAEIEHDLFHLEGLLTKTVLQRILETRTSLSADKIYHVSYVLTDSEEISFNVYNWTAVESNIC